MPSSPKKMPFLRTLKPPVIANIYGTTVEEYAALAERIEAIDELAALEVNISCPNVKAGGVVFGVDPLAAARVVAATRKKTRKTVIVKLSPNVTDIAVIARSVEQAGADAISLINTLTGMAIDIETRRPRLAQHHRRPVGPCHQARGLAHGVAGGPYGAGPGHRHRRDQAGRGRH